MPSRPAATGARNAASVSAGTVFSRSGRGQSAWRKRADEGH